MRADLDLDAYFHRIQWGGSTNADLVSLAGMLEAHMSHIPFENLDVLLGRPIRLDLEGVQAKLVRAHRGGYCFEHGTLFAAVLERLGFTLVRHVARVVMVASREESPRTHMFLKVSLAEGIFVVDPGLGALAPRFPVPFTDQSNAPPADATHWMVRDDPYWVLRARSGDKLVDAWVSTLDRDNIVDFEDGNHFTSTYPRSPFVNHLMMRALIPNGRVAVLDRDVTFFRGSASTTMQLEDRRALRTLLSDYFGFDLPEVETLCVPAIPEWH